MTRTVDTWLSLGVHPPLELVRRRKLEATQALLGDTITFSDDDWQAPSRLRGWTRAHVATHVSRNADALRAVVDDLLAHRPAQLYPDATERAEAIERGARRRGIDIQIDLDTSAGLFSSAIDALEESGSTEPVELSPRLVVPAPVVALARLSEVVLHHSDMGGQRALERLDSETEHWLVAWEMFRAQGDARMPSMVVHTDSGLDVHVGRNTAPECEIWGSDADLLRWLSGRGDAAGLHSDRPAPLLVPR